MLLHIRKEVKLLNITADAAAIDYIEQAFTSFQFLIYSDICRNNQSQLNSKIISSQIYIYIYIYLRDITKHFLLHAVDGRPTRREKRGKEVSTRC